VEKTIIYTAGSVATCECVRVVSCCVTLQINYEFEYTTKLQTLKTQHLFDIICKAQVGIIYIK